MIKTTAPQKELKDGPVTLKTGGKSPVEGGGIGGPFANLRRRLSRLFDAGDPMLGGGTTGSSPLLTFKTGGKNIKDTDATTFPPKPGEATSTKHFRINAPQLAFSGGGGIG